MASVISPTLRDKFESLPIELKNTILEREVEINTMGDLIEVLEDISNDDSEE